MCIRRKTNTIGGLAHTIRGGLTSPRTSLSQVRKDQSRTTNPARPESSTLAEHAL